QRRVVEMVGGVVVRDEERGTYATPAPMSVISGTLPDDSAHRDDHPLEDQPAEARAGAAAAEHGPVPSPDRDGAAAPSADDVLEEGLSDERAARRARDEGPGGRDALAEGPLGGDPVADEAGAD